MGKWYVYRQAYEVNGEGYIPALQRAIASPLEAKDKYEACEIASTNIGNHFSESSNVDFIAIPESEHYEVTVRKVREYRADRNE